MSSVAAAFLFTSTVVAAGALPVIAQEETRIWNGVMQLSSGTRLDVFLTAVGSEEVVGATMNVFDGPVSSVTELAWDERHMRFRWGVFQCALEENGGGGYSGGCDIDGGGAVTLTFAQPADLREAADKRSAGVASGGETLTTADLLASGMLTLYEAIQQLRPRWLIPRGPNKYLRRLFVYVYADGQRIGDVEALRMMRSEDVSNVRYYNASEATLRFGAINEGGAIALTRRR